MTDVLVLLDSQSIPERYNKFSRMLHETAILPGMYNFRYCSVRSSLQRLLEVMSMKKKNFFAKLLKLVGRGNQVQSSKLCLAQIYEERKKLRQRSSLSSHLSHIEPMPTIVEEDETFYYEDEFVRV